MRREVLAPLNDFHYLLHAVVALVGDQLEYGENIWDAMLSIRYNENILSVWNRNASDHHATDGSFLFSLLVLSF
uniref:mRNA cap-binding protein n=1 Tax=Rhizophora mucronata TaxID=61149 RepID=A0A2P2QEU3_RHIMU